MRNHLCSVLILEVEAMRLSSCFGVPLMKKLGKYLGHYVLHQGRNGVANRELVKWVQSRLEGWKLKLLIQSQPTQAGLVSSIKSSYLSNADRETTDVGAQ